MYTDKKGSVERGMPEDLTQSHSAIEKSRSGMCSDIFISVYRCSSVVPSLAIKYPYHPRNRCSIFSLSLLLCLSSALLSAGASAPYLGSKSCRSCYEKFYELWSTSYHGLAMRPYDDAFAQANLTPHDADVTIGNVRYRAKVGAGEGFVQFGYPPCTGSEDGFCPRP